MTRDREVNLGDLNEVTVDEPRANTSRAASGGNGKKAPPGGGKPAPKPQKPASSGGGNGGGGGADRLGDIGKGHRGSPSLGEVVVVRRKARRSQGGASHLGGWIRALRPGHA